MRAPVSTVSDVIKHPCSCSFHWFTCPVWTTGLLVHVNVWAPGDKQEQESGQLHVVTVKHLWEMLPDKRTTKRVSMHCNCLYKTLQTLSGCIPDKPLWWALSHYVLSGRQKCSEMFFSCPFGIYEIYVRIHFSFYFDVFLGTITKPFQENKQTNKNSLCRNTLYISSHRAISRTCWANSHDTVTSYRILCLQQ